VKTHRIAILALALACAGTQKPKHAYEETKRQTVTAKVEALDLATRHVTLRGPEGRTISFRVDESAVNLPQVKVGDEVKVEYVESIVVDVKKPDGSKPDASVTTAVSAAEPGQKPGATADRRVTISATVVAIDRATNQVTLKGPEGNLTVLPVRDPKKLEGVNVGDLLVVTYTEAIAIKVEPPTKM
jgi:Cu/Ag efflux protein CusF